MTIRAPLLFLAAALLAAASPDRLTAQPGREDDAFLRSERRTFAVDVITSPGDSAARSRVDVYVEVPYSALQFVNQGGFFRASYELNVIVGDTTDRLITEKVWSGKVEVDSLQEVRMLRPGEIVQRSLDLEPGRYRFTVRIRDLETDRTSASRLRITVPDYGPGRWKVSDAMILRNVEEEGGRKIITPNIAASISDAADTVFVFLNLYNGLGADSGIVVVEVLDRNSMAVLSDTIPVQLRQGRNGLLPPVRIAPLTVGEFTLRLRAIPVVAAGGAGETAAAGTSSAETERSFSVRWIGAPLDVEDIDAAIDQMQYVAERDFLEEMKALPPGEKRERWAAFWARKDPSPGTERNELMEEYYSRVAYAVRHFGHYTVGWKTDMGMVYIIFGPPSNVERRPFEIDSKPYEIWTYYELNRQFIFVDATGFGDYRLQTPIWDVEHTRPR